MLHKDLVATESSQNSVTAVTLCVGSQCAEMFAYPRSRVPLGRTFSTPPNNMHNMAFFMYSCPWMEGASDLLSNSKISTFLLWASFLHFWTSSLAISRVDSSLSCDMLLAIRIVLQKQMRHTKQLQANQPVTAGICGASEVLSSAATVHQVNKNLVLEISVDLK